MFIQQKIRKILNEIFATKSVIIFHKDSEKMNNAKWSNGQLGRSEQAVLDYFQRLLS